MNSKYYMIVILLMVLGCKDIASQTNKDCTREINLDKTHICLPKFEKMTECYLNLTINSIVNSNVPDESLPIAYYLNDKTYKNIETIEQEVYDDYLFSTDVLSKQKLSRSEFEELSGFDKVLKNDWSKVKQIIKEKIKVLTFDKPIVIETYSNNKNVISSVIMSRILGEETELINIGITNSLFIKDKIIITVYNKHYLDIETIKDAKAKNDYFALRIIQENE